MRKYFVAALLLIGALHSQNIFTIAGIPYNHRDNVDSRTALSAPLGNVYGLLVDNLTGRLIFNDQVLVQRMEADGSVLTLVGTGSAPTPDTAAPLASALGIQILRGMAQDKAGNLYLSEASNGRVYRVALDGTVTTFAGGGRLPPGFRSDGAPATLALLSSPRGLAFDSKGNLDIAEVFCNCIRQVTPDGIISTVYTLPPPTPGKIQNIEGLAIDKQDNLYFTEWLGHVVVKVTADGSGATTIAGTGTPGFNGDGGAATAAQLNGPSGIALDATGNIYIADTLNHRIRRVAPDGTISTIAGTGTCGFAGDGGPAIDAQLCQPAETVLDSSGSLLIADFANRRVRKMTPGGSISTIAGSGILDDAFVSRGPNGDGGPEIHANFQTLGGAAFDPAGNLYVSDTGANVIRKIAADGAVSTIAGTGQRGYSGDGGPAIKAQISGPGPLSVSPDGAVYFITGESRVRKITPDGNISLVAGNGAGTGIIRSQGDGGLAVNATLNEPGQVTFDRQGNVYIADTSNARVRKVDTKGIITTVAGPGPQQGVDYYNAVAVDPQGNLYVSWTHAAPPNISATVNRVNPDGSLTRVAGTGELCTEAPREFIDGTPALQARLCAVVGLAVDKNGLLNMSEGIYALVLRLNADGTMQRVAGKIAPANFGDGGAVLQASLVGGQGWSPEIVTFDPAGDLYIPEPGRNIIRKVTTAPYVLQTLPDRINATGAVTGVLAISANFDEPFPYSVRVTTADGAPWLTTNRVTGRTGESITVRVNPAGLASGTYRGTVSVIVPLPNAPSQQVDVPVSLTLP